MTFCTKQSTWSISLPGNLVHLFKKLSIYFVCVIIKLFYYWKFSNLCSFPVYIKTMKRVLCSSVALCCWYADVLCTMAGDTDRQQLINERGFKVTLEWMRTSDYGDCSVLTSQPFVVLKRRKMQIKTFVPLFSVSALFFRFVWLIPLLIVCQVFTVCVYTLCYTSSSVIFIYLPCYILSWCLGFLV